MASLKSDRDTAAEVHLGGLPKPALVGSPAAPEKLLHWPLWNRGTYTDASSTKTRQGARAVSLAVVACLLAVGCDRENPQILQIRSGNGVELARALKSGEDPNGRSRSGWPLIVEAAYTGRADMMEALLQRGADPNAANGNGFTALSEAAREGHTEIVRLLLAAGASSAKVDEQLGSSALHWAALGGHVPAAELLLRAGAAKEAVNKRGETPLLVAIRAERPEMVRTLLRAGADPRHVVTLPGGQVQAPLDTAASIEEDETATAITRLLLAAGAPVEQKGWMERTPLIAAAQWGNRQCAQTLLAAGANPNAIGGYYQKTALIWAAGAGNHELAAVLIRGGATPDVRLADNTYASATSAAFERTDAAMLELLLRAGGEPNLLDPSSGRTLLQEALQRGNNEVAEVLRAHGGA